MKIDFSKPVQTRDGRPARILATDLRHPDYSVVAAVSDGNNLEEIIRFTPEGSFWKARGGRPEPDRADLVNVPRKIGREIWVNVYPTDDSYGAMKSKAVADQWAGGTRIACVKVVIDCNEGDGL